MAYAWPTLKHALLAPGFWVLSALGVLAVLAGMELGILATGDTPESSAMIAAESGGAAACALVVWIIVTVLDGDSRAALAQAADQTRSGLRGRICGRLLGASLAGLLAYAASMAASVAIGGIGWHDSLWLYVTTLLAIPPMAAFSAAVLLLTRSPAGALWLAGSAWFLRHLPWGASGWDPLGMGRVVGGLLGCASTTPFGVLIPLLSAAGWLFLALAAGRAGAPSA